MPLPRLDIQQRRCRDIQARADIDGHRDTDGHRDADSRGRVDGYGDTVAASAR